MAEFLIKTGEEKANLYKIFIPFRLVSFKKMRFQHYIERSCNAPSIFDPPKYLTLAANFENVKHFYEHEPNGLRRYSEL